MTDTNTTTTEEDVMARLQQVAETLGACYAHLAELGYTDMADRALKALEVLRSVEKVLHDCRPIPSDMDLKAVLSLYGIRELAKDIDVHENTVRKVYEGVHSRRPWQLLFKIASAPGWRARGVEPPSVEDLNEKWEAHRWPHKRGK